MAGYSSEGAGGPPDAVGPFASSWRRRHLTVDERVARGHAARREVPRPRHGRWEPAPDRPDPVTLLEQQAASRVPDIVPIRYGRMLASPFTFYRGGGQVGRHDQRGAAVEGERRGQHPAVADRDQVGYPAHRLLFQQRDRIGAVRGGLPSSVTRPWCLLARG